ncbi:hypothetical protein J2X06_001131 [Lysobacter niastensis]|jgi:hypothetical protein|uniref:Secreted protein n=1 Tax=Lysobacter niastensis TaxID=380629 RepID=A0ABU1W8M5_9GAMM|nr:hypothetical protein [Lysobacter niastensis]MDR7133947.1 hypothetical protein [Lysobacter niastensis]
MKNATRLLLIACLSLPFLAACKKEEQKVAAVEAPLTAPTTSDENAWNAYLTDVVKRNLDGVSNTYVYVLPAEGSQDFQGYYDRQLEKAQTDISRGILEGNLLAFGSPTSAKTADLTIAAFSKAQPGSMKGVKVLFIGAAADNDRVKAAVAPAGVDYKFVEAK